MTYDSDFSTPAACLTGHQQWPLFFGNLLDHIARFFTIKRPVLGESSLDHFVQVQHEAREVVLQAGED
jgi:hypothetical protein